MSLHVNIPVAGFYRLRDGRGGRWLAVQIVDVSDRDSETGELMEDQRFAALIDDAWRPIEHAWPHCANNPITEAEYRYLLDARPKVLGVRHTVLTAPIPF